MSGDEALDVAYDSRNHRNDAGRSSRAEARVAGIDSDLRGDLAHGLGL